MADDLAGTPAQARTQRSHAKATMSEPRENSVGWAIIAVVAALAVGLAVGAFVDHHWFGPSPPPPQLVRPGISGIVRPTSEEESLAKAFSPLLVFGSFNDDPWRPQPVAQYLCHASLVGSATALADANQPAQPLPQTGPASSCSNPKRTPTSHGPGCRSSWPLPYEGGLSCVLDLQGCTLRDDWRCYSALYPPTSQIPPNQPERDYYITRVLRIPAKTDQRLNGTLAQLHWLFQYWFFYAFDDWGSTRPALRQVHEGDWEFAAVGVSQKRQPLFVAYSHHCFGGWSRFGDPGLHVFREGGGQHPILYVADGSHALYRTAGTPNVKLAHCALGLSLRSHLSSLGGLQDHTVPKSQAAAALASAEQTEEDPARRPLITWIGAHASWALFNEPWGEGEAIQLPTGRWYTDALGPTGPAFQGRSWTLPVYTILCSGAWTNDSAGMSGSGPVGDPCKPAGEMLAPSRAAAARPS